MEYVSNLMDADADVAEWARRREGQGWQVLSVADHFYSATRPFPHVWVSAAAIASATTHVTVTTAFVNNLLRSPVEVAQAALMMQSVSHGRFELGLGAGWLREEVVAAGMTFPEAADRAGAFVEATTIIRSLLHTGAAQLDGKYYTVDARGLGPLSNKPPRLVGSVGGPRTVREVTPLLDRVEIKASSHSTRGGALDFAAMATIPDSHLADMVARVRDVRPDIEIGMFVFCNAGTDARTKQLHEALKGSLYGRFFGPVAHLAEGLAWLEDQGVSRTQISPLDDATFDALAPLLF